MSYGFKSTSDLVVDDDDAVRGLVAVLFRGMPGYDVKEAGDGLQAARIAEEMRPDAVVTDYSMPGLNGIDLCRYLRAQPETCHAKLLLMTAMPLTNLRSTALAAGVDVVLAKPFTAMSMLNTVEKMFRKGPSGLAVG